jgi:hypothetical protein
MKATVLLILLALALGAKDKPAADPVLDKDRFELARLELEFEKLRAPAEAAVVAANGAFAKVQAKIAELNKACGPGTFDQITWKCAAAPAPTAADSVKAKAEECQKAGKRMTADGTACIEPGK